MPSIAAREFQALFATKLSDSARFSPAEVNALVRAAGKIKDVDEKEAAQEILELVRHDYELDENEVEPAKKALCRLLGTSSSQLPPALQKALKNAVPVPNVRVQSYDLTFDFSKEGNAFPARAKIALEKKAPKTTILECDPTRIAIDEVRVGGKVVPFRVERGRVFVDAPGAKLLDIKYTLTPTEDMASYGLIRDRHSGQMWTMTWPYNTGALFPSNSHPSDGATARVTVHVPKGTEVVGPGAPHGQSHTLSRPVPAYAVSFYVGQFSSEKSAHDGHSHARTAGFGKKIPEATRKEMREAAAGAMDYFSTWLGPYAFKDRMNIVEIPTTYGGMEHAGAVAIGIGQSREDSVEAAVHETAHMWFGDTVRIGAWGELWMSESFTNYITFRYYEQRDGEGAFFKLMDRSKDLVRTQLKSKAHPLSMPDATDVQQVFTDLVYHQGPWLLRMMETQLGRERFDALLSDWYKEKRYSAVTTKDFVTFLKEKTGTDFKPFFDAWNELKAVPRVKDASRIDGTTAHLSLVAANALPEGLAVPAVLHGKNGETKEVVVVPGAAVDVDAGFAVARMEWDPKRTVLVDVVAR